MSDFTLTWTLDAPPADVFRAWTDPEQLGWYYNPEYPVPAEPIELDLEFGGVWRQYMVIDDETAYFTGGVYREIVRACASAPWRARERRELREFAGVGTTGGRCRHNRGLNLWHVRATYSSERPVASRSRSYRFVSGKGGNQDSRRTIQSS
jgi:hypothetical protein